ncbi:MAG: response regulator [Candidatus Omnitrophota bacterium]|jgi:two-component system alkaline phosphatase synthesis response regulator PhoP|nr:MAG: response regulator [Candidatus Omnitrophota bacterium]
MPKKKILVVDDEAHFLELIKMRLEANGYEVVTANSGREAINILNEKKPDAVLLDIIMPDIDGIKVLEEIRKKYKKLPVFMITGFSGDERFKLANTFEASGFIVKTKDLNEEIKNITGVLNMADRYKKS